MERFHLPVLDELLHLGGHAISQGAGVYPGALGPFFQFGL